MSVDLVSLEWHIMLGHTCSGISSPHWGVSVVAEVVLAQLSLDDGCLRKNTA